MIMTAKKFIFATVDVGLITNAIGSTSVYYWWQSIVLQLNIEEGLVQSFAEAIPILGYVALAIRVLFLIIKDGEEVYEKFLDIRKKIRDNKKDNDTPSPN